MKRIVSMLTGIALASAMSLGVLGCGGAPSQEDASDDAAESMIEQASEPEPSSPYYESADEIPTEVISRAYDYASVRLMYDDGAYGAGGSFSSDATASPMRRVYFCRDTQGDEGGRTDRLVIVYEVTGESSKSGDTYTFYGYYSIKGITRDGLLDYGSYSVLFAPVWDGKQTGARLETDDPDQIIQAIDERVNWEYWRGDTPTKRYEVEEVPDALVPQPCSPVTPIGLHYSDEEVDEIMRVQFAPDVAIGMTADEVLASKWGAPEKKNITETASGTSEQWVYPNNQYVYLEDGIVTGIQRTE